MKQQLHAWLAVVQWVGCPSLSWHVSRSLKHKIGTRLRLLRPAHRNQQYLSATTSSDWTHMLTSVMMLCFLLQGARGSLQEAPQLQQLPDSSSGSSLGTWLL